jgi:hypothetical protein
MNQSTSLSPAHDTRNQSRNPGQPPTNGSPAGTVFANITGGYHGPTKTKKSPKTKTPSGDIVGKVAKVETPGAKKLPAKKKGAGKAK